MATVVEVLAQALDCHRAGKLQEAERLYQFVLEQKPNQSGAIHWLGVLLYQKGEMQEAAARLRQAAQLNPSSAVFHNHLGLAYQAIGMVEEAKKSYQTALSLCRKTLQQERSRIEANLARAVGELLSIYIERGQFYYNLDDLPAAAHWDLACGNLLVEAGRDEVAKRYFLQAIALQPESSEAHYRLAEIYVREKRWEAAIASCRESLRHQDDRVDAYKLMGNAFASQQDLQSAAQCYAKALDVDPNFAEAQANLANILVASNRNEEAVVLYRRALQNKPELRGIYRGLGRALENLGRLDEAIATWQTLSPQEIGGENYYRLGMGLMGKNRRDKGLEFLRQAIAVQPHFMKAYWDLCEILGLSNKLAPAREMADRCSQIARGRDRLLSDAMFVKAYLKSGYSEAARKRFEEMEVTLLDGNLELSGSEAAKLYLSFFFDIPHLRDDLAANAKIYRYLARHYNKLLDIIIQRFPHRSQESYSFPTPGEPLKIGFLSRHFRRHSVSWCGCDAMREIAQITPHVYFYLSGKLAFEDHFTRTYEEIGHFYRPQKYVGDVGDGREIADRAIEDGLDVLVDLDSITVRNHPEIMRRRPAPVCITWLGYDAPYSNDCNYYLGDWYTHPTGVESHYMEKLVRLPGTFAAVRQLPYEPVDRDRARRALRVGPEQVAFLCVALGFKFSSEMVEAQVSILKRVPNSVLMHKARLGDDEVMQSLYREECVRQGVSFARVKFLPRTRTEEEHRRIYIISDILLDSYPYNGGTHTVEALWMNLPVVTWAGRQSFSRMGYSLLSNAGMEEGVAFSMQEYIEKAVRFGNDRALRAAARSRLSKFKEPDNLAPLWDPKKFARDMYRTFEDLVAKEAANRGVARY